MTDPDEPAFERNDKRPPAAEEAGDTPVAAIPDDLEKRMEIAFFEDRRTTTRLGLAAVWCWITATMLLTGGGLLGVIGREQDNEGLRYAMVAASVPAMSLLAAAVVTTFLWSRRSQRVTLETLQVRLERLERMLRDD